LQADLSAGRTDRFRYYVFDFLYEDGADLRKLPLHVRKARLAGLIEGAPDVLRLSEDFAEDGEAMLDHACRLSLEGLVSKRRDGAYPAGRRALPAHWSGSLPHSTATASDGDARDRSFYAIRHAKRVQPR